LAIDLVAPLERRRDPDGDDRLAKRIVFIIISVKTRFDFAE
jgi:hypothetical protein